MNILTLFCICIFSILPLFAKSTPPPPKTPSLRTLSGLASDPNGFFQKQAFRKVDEADLQPREVDLLKSGHQGQRHLTGHHYVRRTTEGTEQWSFPHSDTNSFDKQLGSFFKKTFSGKSHFSNQILKGLGLDFHYMDFFPTTIGTVTSKKELHGSDHKCYKKMTFKLDIVKKGPSYKKGHVVLHVDTSDYEPHVKMCHTTLMIMTRQFTHYMDIPFKGKHTLDVCTFHSQEDFDDVLDNGFRVFELPLGWAGTLASLTWHTKLFTQKTMYESNLEWSKEILSFPMEERKNGQPINIDKNLIPSGSFLAIQAPAFFDTLISWGTGSTIGHSVVLLWKNQSTTLGNPMDNSDLGIDRSGRELWACESTDVTGDPGLPNSDWPGHPGEDFPPPYGQGACRKYDEWVEQAYRAGFWVNLLPLKPEYAAKFDEEKAWELVEQLKGQDYGYSTFVYTFLDTLTANWPYPATSLFMEMFLGNADRLINAPLVKLAFKDPKFTLKTIFIDGLNMRLTHYAKEHGIHFDGVDIDHDGFVSCKTFVCVWKAIDQLDGVTMPQIWSIPSQDSWLYPNLQNGERTWDSNVCSVFVCRTLKAAGVFGDLDFQCNEITPRDLSRISIWQDDTSWKPSECNQVPGDEKHGWCQIIGYNTMYIKNYATREPKEDMFFHCGANNWDNGNYDYQPADC